MEKYFSISFLNTLYKEFQTAEFMESAFKILIIVLISLLILKISSKFVNKLRKVLEKTSLVNDERVKLRTKTICNIINSCIIVFISIITIILIMGELGINIAPILAGAGVLGLAVSFGAQNLVKDVITGFFILFEDQFGIGDVIQVDSHAGIVESMNLRTTILRDLSGNVHIIPNGEIKQVVVMTKHWARAVVDIQVFYKQDINKVLDIIRDITNIIYNERKDQILEAPEVLGINSIDSNGVTIRVIVKTKPAEQWSVEREIRRKVIEKFNEQGIDLPFFQSSSLDNLK